jgi:hypothetical protein
MGIYETGNGTGTATTGTGTSSYVDGVKDITNKQYVFKNAGIYEFKAGEEKTRSYNLYLTVNKNAKFNSKVNVKVVATQKD